LYTSSENTLAAASGEVYGSTFFAEHPVNAIATTAIVTVAIAY